MKKFIVYLLVVCLSFSFGYFLKPAKDFFGARISSSQSYSSFNTFDGSSSTINATTTQAASAVLALASNSSRKYAKISNDSDTKIYLVLDEYTTFASATDGIIYQTGIPVAANSSFEINSNNLYTGDVWIATATADKLITTTEIN